jgi:hypothetical protein
MTDNNNGISVLMKRKDNEEIVVVDNLVIWGGVSDSAFSRLVYVTIDPSFLGDYSTFYIKSSQEGYDVAVGCIFAEIYLCKYNKFQEEIEINHGKNVEIRPLWKYLPAS